MMASPDGGASVSFDWAIYADATLAGLSALIPAPFVDSLTENFFRKRMVHSIAARRKRTLHAQTGAVVNGENGLWSHFGGCLVLPLRFMVELILRLSRKILYFLAIKKAVDNLNYYWQRAYLLDYMVRQGYLEHEEKLQPAVNALEQVLKEKAKSPLTNLARELVRSPHRLAQSVRRARQGVEDAEIAHTQSQMSRAWDRYAGYFQRLQDHYEAVYQAHRQMYGVDEAIA